MIYYRESERQVTTSDWKHIPNQMNDQNSNKPRV